MYREPPYARNIFNYLEAFLYQQLGNVPIRLLSGDGQAHDPATVRESWTAEQLAGTPYDGDISEANAHGVTILAYGSLSGHTTYGERPIYGGIAAVAGYSDPYIVHDACVTDDALYPTFTDNRGMVLGEYDERVIAFHAPLSGFPFRREATNLDILFGDSLTSCLDQERFADLETRRLERLREQFGDAIQGRNDVELRTQRASIDELENNLAQYQNRAQQIRRQLTNAQEQLDAVIARREAGAIGNDQVETEWNAIHRHAAVKRLNWQSDTLHVYTDDITLTRPDTGASTIVGAFDIRLNLNESTINVHNLTNRRGSHDHPHVREGDFCGGELGPTLHRLIQERQVAAAINLAIDALEHVNPNDDWGRRVAWWFDEAGHADEIEEDQDE